MRFLDVFKAEILRLTPIDAEKLHSIKNRIILKVSTLMD